MDPWVALASCQRRRSTRDCGTSKVSTGVKLSFNSVLGFMFSQLGNSSALMVLWSNAFATFIIRLEDLLLEDLLLEDSLLEDSCCSYVNPIKALGGTDGQAKPHCLSH
jgi:hypothetical protein